MTNNIIQFPYTQIPGAQLSNTRFSNAQLPDARLPNTVRPIANRPEPAAAQYKRQQERPLSEAEIWEALLENRVQVRYQPQYNLRTGSCNSAEALVRLIGRDGSVIKPDRFIEVAENTGLIAILGRRVIEQGCWQLASWREEGCPVQRLSINVSALQLELDWSLEEFVDDVLRQTWLEYSDLEFELTERQHLRREAEGRGTIHTLASRGCRIVIDDFGVGFASNEYLSELPVSGIKLDCAMTQRACEDRTAAVVVQHLIALAFELGLDVVAEGIESQAHENFLHSLKCPTGQGFLFSKPLTGDEFIDFYHDRAG